MTKKQSLCKRVFFSIYSYTIIYALFGVLSLSYHSCFNSSLSTLEKRYRFTSTTGGYIMITDNVATILTNLFIGFYGKRAHKPRWMSIGCVVTGLSVLITALPYFIYGPAQEKDLSFVGNMTLSKRSKFRDQLCLSGHMDEDCSSSTVDAHSLMTMVAVSCFGISNFFRGFGTSIYFTYGTTYLDDNVSKAKMPTFFAFVFALRILGAPIGFLISSSALRYYENPISVPPGLTPTDPRWIGAWWFGFLVTGSLMLLLAIPLSLFPREFRKKHRTVNEPGELELVEQTPAKDSVNAAETKSKKLSSSAEDLNPKDPKSKNQSLKQLPSEIYAIISNPIIICQMMGNLFRGIGIIGYFVFQTKYLESQFRQSASKASLVSGTTGFLAKVIGVVFGGLVITLFRPRAKILTTYIFIVELTSVFTLLYGASIMGPQYNYPRTTYERSGELDLYNNCNKPCECTQVRYQPVCNLQEMSAYFSPCHAGCSKSYTTADNSSVYTDCSCSINVTTLEKCPPDGEKLMEYATIIALGGMISGSSRSGNMVTFFRSINPDQKSLAVAVGSFWHSLMVSIPYPILYGKIFDYCCLVWNNECGKRGNCWLYDTEKLRHIYHGVSIALIAMGSVFDLIMICLSSRLKNLYDDDGKKTFIGRITAMCEKPADAHEEQEAANGKSKEEDQEKSDSSPVVQPGVHRDACQDFVGG